MSIHNANNRIITTSPPPPPGVGQPPPRSMSFTEGMENEERLYAPHRRRRLRRTKSAPAGRRRRRRTRRRRRRRRTRRRRRRRRTRRRRQKRGGRWSPYNKDWSSLPKNYRVMIQYHGPGRESASGDGNSTAYGNFQLKDNVFKRIGKAQDGDGGPDSIEKYRVHSVWFWDETPRLDDGNYNSQGGRRRTRKQRGGICPSCIAPLMILPLLGKNKKKKGRRRRRP